MIEVNGREIVYLDNAATSLPKPGVVAQAVMEALSRAGNPGRSGHFLSFESMRDIFEAREAISRLIQSRESKRVILTGNATWALNMALKGSLAKEDHVISTVMEHNSVLRPLQVLGDRGVDVTLVEADITGRIDPADIERSIKSNTKMVAMVHASNVTGTINDVMAVGNLCRERGLLFLLDASQTAGVLGIDVESMNIDLLASSGHKALFGPQGTGFLYVGERTSVIPLIEGGTGSRSEKDRQPEFLPDMLEAGTLNSPGFAGLRRGVEYVLHVGVKEILSHERKLLGILTEGLTGLERVRLYGPESLDDKVGLLLMNIEGLDPGEFSLALDEEEGILGRGGLHCAPLAHRVLGTFPEGAVRLSFSVENTEEDALRAVAAVKNICSRH